MKQVPTNNLKHEYLLKTLVSTIVRIWDFSFVMLLTIWAHQLNLHYHSHTYTHTQKKKKEREREREDQAFVLTFLCASSGKGCLNFHLLKASNMSSKSNNKANYYVQQRHIWMEQPHSIQVHIKMEKLHWPTLQFGLIAFSIPLVSEIISTSLEVYVIIRLTPKGGSLKLHWQKGANKRGVWV